MRVKVFRLSEEKSSSPSPQSVWIDCGIGLLEFCEGEDDGKTRISVVSESDNDTVLMGHGLSTQHMYERQGPSIIRFTEVYDSKSIDHDDDHSVHEQGEGVEFALSFHQTLDCNEVWAEVQKVLPDDEHDLGVLHPTFRRVCYPHVNTFHKLAQLYSVSMDPGRHDMVDGLVHMCLHVGWFESLFELFDRYEAEEAYGNLESMHNMFLAIFMLDDPQIFQILLLKEDNLMKTIACLEYDENKRLKNQSTQAMSTGTGDAESGDNAVGRGRCDQHRRFLQSAKLKMPIDLPNEPNGEPLYTKITMTYRTTYIHDVILLPYIDDDNSPNFNDLIYAQRDVIAHRLAGSPQFLKELFSQLMMPDESAFSAVSESDFSSVRDCDEEGDCGNSPPNEDDDEHIESSESANAAKRLGPSTPKQCSTTRRGEANAAGEGEVHHVSLGNLFIRERGTDTSSCPPTPTSTTSESHMGGDHGDASSLLSHHSARFEMFQFFDDMKKLFNSLRIDIKGELYKAMYEQGVFLCLEQVAFEVDPVNTPGGLQIWMSICDTINTYLALNVAFLRTFLTAPHLVRDRHLLDSLMGTFCLPKVDDGLGRQCFEIAKLVFNAETMSDDEKRRFIPYLYNTQISRIVGALGNSPMFTPSPWTQRYSATEFLTFCVRSHSSPRITLNIHPNFRDCYIKMRIFERVFGCERTSVIHSARKNEVLAAIRFLREVIGLKDPRYISRIVENNMMDPVMRIYEKFGAAYNLMNSAVLDLLKFISDNNLDDLILYLGTHHMAILRGCDHAGTFAKLLRQYSKLANVPLPPPTPVRAATIAARGSGGGVCLTPLNRRVESTHRSSAEEFLTPSRPSKGTSQTGALPRTPRPQHSETANSGGSSTLSPGESSALPFPTTPTTPRTLGDATQQIAGVPMSFCTTPPRTPEGARHRTPMPKMRLAAGGPSSLLQHLQQGGMLSASETSGEQRKQPCVVSPSSDGGGSSQTLLEQFSALDKASKSPTTSPSTAGGLSSALMNNAHETTQSPSSLLLGEAGDSSPHLVTPMVLTSPSNSDASSSSSQQASQPAPVALASLMQGDRTNPSSHVHQNQDNVVQNTDTNAKAPRNVLRRKYEKEKCGSVSTTSSVNVHMNSDDERKIDSPANIYRKSKISTHVDENACMMNIVQSPVRTTTTNVCNINSKNSPTNAGIVTTSSSLYGSSQAKKQKLSPPMDTAGGRRVSPTGKRKVSPDKETQDQYEAGAKTAKTTDATTAVADRSALKDATNLRSPTHDGDVANFLNLSAHSPSSVFEAGGNTSRTKTPQEFEDGSGRNALDVEMRDSRLEGMQAGADVREADDLPSKRRKMP